VAGRRQRIPSPAGWVLQAVSTIVVAFAAVRAVRYPFWAAGAAPADLSRSWGGPTAVGATLVHWGVAALLAAAGAGLFLLGRRRRSWPWSGPRPTSCPGSPPGCRRVTQRGESRS
jgi:hypothetical protein